MVNKPLLDTNLIIRFLVNDLPEQANQVEQLLKGAGVGTLEISDLVIAEIVYVLLSYYEVEKIAVIEKIGLLIEFEKIKCHKKLIKTTLEIYKENPVSFVDAYLTALVVEGKNSLIYSFDKDLAKIKQGKVKTP